MIAESVAYLLILASFSLFFLRRGAKPGLSKMKTLDSSHIATAERKDGRNFLQ